MSAIAIAAAALQLGAPGAGGEAPARGGFVGSAACGQCHEREYERWLDTPHARAYESLGDDAVRPECRSCHTTGDAPFGPARFASVGCEACHGRGEAYAPADVMANPPLARALGLRDLSTEEARAALCERCHGTKRTQIAPFEAEEAWEEIAH